MIFEYKNQTKINSRFISHIERARDKNSRPTSSITFWHVNGNRITWNFETKEDFEEAWDTLTLTDLDKSQRKLAGIAAGMTDNFKQFQSELLGSHNSEECLICGSAYPSGLIFNGCCPNCARKSQRLK